MAAVELYNTPLYSDANLVAYWRFEGNSNDSKGSNDGTDSSISYNAAYGKFGQGAYFSGSGYITLANTNFKPTGDFTFVTWFYTGATGTGMTFFQSYYDGAAEPQGWTIETESNDKVKMVQGDGSSFINENGGADIIDSNWHHMACVYINSESKTYVYIDGGSSWTTSAKDTTFNGSSNVSFGHRSNTGGDDGFKFNGYMDDAAFFSRALTSTEIDKLYNGTFTSVKSVAGVARGSIGKINGTSVGSIKKIAGVA
jgi:hypothetical protein